MRRIAALFVALFLLLLAIGCGGGGGGSSSTGGDGDVFVKPKVSIAWPARSKAINAPASALSALIVLRASAHSGADTSFSVDRSGPVSGSMVTYTGSEEAKVGPLNVTVAFYAGPGATGAIVGTASGIVTLGADGVVSTSITTSGTVATVEVVTGQTLNVGETKQLDFGCRNGDGELLAVSPGSAIWSISSGLDKLSFAEGKATGITLGDATVTATVDGRTSSATTVHVQDPSTITVTIAPSMVSVSPSSSQQFTATVQGAGNTAVTWSVVEQNAGSISASGLYVAPAATGTYTVKAVSVANPAKSSSATVHVENVRLSVQPTTATCARKGTVQITATVTGTSNHGVSWTLIESGGGVVSGTGLYTAPDLAGTYTIRGTSDANPSVHADAKVTVTNALFLTIGRLDARETGLPFITGVTCISGDGTTLGSRLATDNDNAPPAYWRQETGWTLLMPSGSGAVATINHDGTAMTGWMYTAPTGESYLWKVPGGATRIRAPFGRPDPQPTAISADGKIIFGSGQASESYKWSATGGTIEYSSLLPILACSDVGDVVAGAGKAVNGRDLIGSLWTEAGDIERIGGRQIPFLSSDASCAVIDDFGTMKYWTRSGALVTLNGNGVTSMSRNGKYLVLHHDDGTLTLWSPGRGETPIATVLAAAGAPADVDYVTCTVVLSADGTVMAGDYRKTLPGGGFARYAFYARLPAAP